MNKSILDYLKTQRVGVLAVEMMDGSPHAATVHFAHTDDPFIFYFETNKTYRKAEALLGREVTRASIVIGSTEADMRTLQLDGTVKLLKDSEQDLYNEVYLGMFPEKREKSKDPNFVRFSFIPTWWRFTDFTGPNGKVIISSE